MLAKIINFFSLFLVFNLASLSVCFASSFENLEFQSISTDKGLSQKTVQAILQDSHGFIWIGTQEGLNRYDGKKIITYRNSLDNKHSLSSNVIREIIEDSERYIWIATSAGLSRYNATNDSFDRIDLFDKNGQTIKKIYSLYQEENGNLLVGTDGHGIFSIDVKNNNSIEQSSKFMPLLSADIRVIFKDSRGRYWIGTDGEGLWLFDSSGNEISNFKADKETANSLSHNRIRAVFEDSGGRLWIGTRGGGLNRFDELDKSFFHYKTDSGEGKSISSNRVYKVLEDQSRSLWIATDGGINMYSSETDSFVTVKNHPSQPSSLNNDRVLALFEDSGGLIWIGTFSGINIWNPTTAKFVHHRHISEDKSSLSNNTVFGLETTSDGGVYAATFGGGLNYFDPNKRKWSTITQDENQTNLELDDRLMSLLVDREEQLWVGSFSKGISVLSKEGKLIKHFKNKPSDSLSLSANGVTDIFQDSDDEIWIATYAAGLNRLTRNGDNFIRYRKDSKSNKGPVSESVFQLMEDDEGYIWLATGGGGISRLDKNTGNFTNFTHEPGNEYSLTGDTAWSIFQDSRGRFWIGTQGRGLNRWEPEDRRQGKNHFKRYTSQNGLPSSTVNGVLEDDQGHIWISTNKGVSRLNPETDEIQNFDLTLEVHDNELNQGAMAKGGNGQLYFGGLNGISTFNPNEIKTNQHIPKIALTSIHSQGEAMELDEPVTDLEQVSFSYTDYLVTFEFATLDFSQPSKNQYQYKLEGFDPEWIAIGTSNRATYTNLPSGQYVFRAKGSNNDGLWSEEPISLRVIVKPAPWASWWAFTLYILCFCVTLIAVIRSQAKRIANQDSFRKNIDLKVEQKLILLEKDNLQLKEKLEDIEANHCRDHKTGLYTKDFFTEQLVVCLKLLKNAQKNELSCKQKLYCILVNIGNKDVHNSKDNKGDGIVDLSRYLVESEKNIHLVSTWGEHEIGLIMLADSDSDSDTQAKSLVARISDKNKDAGIGYIGCPLSLQDDCSYQWEHILVMTEHAMRWAFSNKNKQSIGVLSCYQKLTPHLIKEFITSEDISELTTLFELETR